MGQYFRVVCHDCCQFMSPSLLKVREICLNPHIAAEVGWFVAFHAGHHVELRGDEHTYDHRIVTCPEKYEEQTLDDLAQSDSDIAHGVEQLRRMREAEAKENG